MTASFAACTAFVALSRFTLVLAKAVGTALYSGFAASPLLPCFSYWGIMQLCILQFNSLLASAKSESIPICFHMWIKVQTWRRDCLGVLGTHIATWAHSLCWVKSTWSMWPFYFSWGHPAEDHAQEYCLWGNSSLQFHAHTLSPWALPKLTSWMTWLVESLLDLILEKVSWKNFFKAGKRNWHGDMQQWQYPVSQKEFLGHLSVKGTASMWGNTQNFWSLTIAW